MSEITLEKIKEKRKEGYIPAACVHCGGVWWLPKDIAKEYGANRPYECAYCLNKMRIFTGGTK